MLLFLAQGMARRYSQRKDEQRAIDNKIKLEQRLTEIREDAAARRAAIAEASAKRKQKAEDMKSLLFLTKGDAEVAQKIYEQYPSDMLSAIVENAKNYEKIGVDAIIDGNLNPTLINVMNSEERLNLNKNIMVNPNASEAERDSAKTYVEQYGPKENIKYYDKSVSDSNKLFNSLYDSEVERLVKESNIPIEQFGLKLDEQGRLITFDANPEFKTFLKQIQPIVFTEVKRQAKFDGMGYEAKNNYFDWEKYRSSVSTIQPYENKVIVNKKTP